MKSQYPDMQSIPFGNMLTTSGKVINLFDPDPTMIEIEDIASSLSKLCRWGGNISHFYSVAQHSCFVAWLSPSELNFAGLMHDAAEAYAGDVIRPIKSLLSLAYSDIEARLMDAICTRFQLHPDMLSLVKQYDNKALYTEYAAFHRNDNVAREFIRSSSSAWLDVMPHESFWQPQSGYVAFLNTFHRLFQKNRKVTEMNGTMVY